MYNVTRFLPQGMVCPWCNVGQLGSRFKGPALVLFLIERGQRATEAEAAGGSHSGEMEPLFNVFCFFLYLDFIAWFTEWDVYRNEVSLIGNRYYEMKTKVVVFLSSWWKKMIATGFCICLLTFDHILLMAILLLSVSVRWRGYGLRGSKNHRVYVFVSACCDVAINDGERLVDERFISVTRVWWHQSLYLLNRSPYLFIFVYFCFLFAAVVFGRPLGGFPTAQPRRLGLHSSFRYCCRIFALSFLFLCCSGDHRQKIRRYPPSVSFVSRCSCSPAVAVADPYQWLPFVFHPNSPVSREDLFFSLSVIFHIYLRSPSCCASCCLILCLWPLSAIVICLSKILLAYWWVRILKLTAIPPPDSRSRGSPSFSLSSIIHLFHLPFFVFYWYRTIIVRGSLLLFLSKFF